MEVLLALRFAVGVIPGQDAETERLSGRNEDRLVQLDRDLLVLRQGGVLIDGCHAGESFSEAIVDMDIHTGASFGLEGQGDGLNDKPFFLLCSNRIFDVAVCHLVYLSGWPEPSRGRVTLLGKLDVPEVDG